MQVIKNRTRRFKFWIHLIRAYVQRYKYPTLLIIISIFVIAFLFSYLWPKIARSNIVTIGYVGNYTIETIPTNVLALATKSLITADQEGKPIPSLASHWTLTEDGKTYIVFLKDNLIWHDGTPVDAKDITIAIENVQITALNNKAIEFKLPNPISSFPTAMDKPVFKAKSFYGTGEFRITEIRQSGGTIHQIGMTPKNKDLPRVDIKFYQTQDQLQNAIKVGDVKFASVASSKIFEKWPNLEVTREVEDSEAVTIFFNTEDPLLMSKEFRQALNHAIDKSNFDGETALSPTSKSSWAYNPDVKRYDYNTGKAKELLSKSEVKDPKVVLSYVSGFGDVAASVQNNWQDLGIGVEIKEEKTIPQNFQALLAIDKIPPDPDQYGLWHSTQTTTNLTHFKDEKIDKLLEDGRTQKDEAERKKLYFDFQRFLMEDAPIALLYHPYKYEVRYKNLGNLINKLPQTQ